MTGLPRIQILALSVALLAGAVLGRFVAVPLLRVIAARGHSIMSTFDSNDEATLRSLREESARLARLEKEAARLSEATQTTAHWYDQLQKVLAAGGIVPDRIGSGGTATRGDLQGERFSFTSTTHFHNVGRAMSALESGPHICSVHTIHLTALSLTDAQVQAEVSVEFVRRTR